LQQWKQHRHDDHGHDDECAGRDDDIAGTGSAVDR
jgi:hypothetical protein